MSNEKTSEPEAQTPLIDVRNASKSFGGVLANDNVSLCVPEGGIVGLIGPNGSGKSTLFNSIAGSHRIDSGVIKFAGREISKLETQAIARRGLIRTFQQTHIYPQMDCMDNLLASAPTGKATWLQMMTIHTADERERAAALLEFVALYPQRRMKAGELSFGQQKLLEFAMALMNKPRALLLDEPTAGVNPTIINSLIERLRYANAELGITLLLIEHNMPVIMGLAEYIYCLAHGQLLAEGTPEMVRNDPRVIEAYLGAR